MPFHLALYDASIANGAVLLQVANVADPVVATSGSGFLVPKLNKLAQVAAVGTNLTRVQLTSYTIRQKALFDIGPVNVGTVIESPARFSDFTDRPIQLATNEELDAFGVQSNAGAQRISVGVWFCDGPLRPISGDYFTMHWTGTTTLTANGWTACTITFDNGLPEGLLAIVGMRVISAGALFARLLPRQGDPFRPGVMAFQAQDGYDIGLQRYGQMGEFIRFQNTTPPQVEIFSRSADTTQEGYFDLAIVG